MANIVVTSTPNCINVVFNDMAQYAHFKTANFDLYQITFQQEFHDGMLPTDDAHCVRVYDKHGAPWCVTYSTNPNLIAPNVPMLSNGTPVVLIDSVNGVTASSNQELYTQLIAMKG